MKWYRIIILITVFTYSSYYSKGSVHVNIKYYKNFSFFNEKGLDEVNINDITNFKSVFQIPNSPTAFDLFSVKYSKNKIEYLDYSIYRLKKVGDHTFLFSLNLPDICKSNDSIIFRFNSDSTVIEKYMPGESTLVLSEKIVLNSLGIIKERTLFSEDRNVSLKEQFSYDFETDTVANINLWSRKNNSMIIDEWINLTNPSIRNVVNENLMISLKSNKRKDNEEILSDLEILANAEKTYYYFDFNEKYKYHYLFSSTFSFLPFGMQNLHLYKTYHLGKYSSTLSLISGYEMRAFAVNRYPEFEEDGIIIKNIKDVLEEIVSYFCNG